MDYLSASASKSKKNQLQLFNSIPVVFVNPFLSNIDPIKIIAKVQSIIPASFAEGIESLYVGNFSFLDDRKLQAMLADGVIYVASTQRNNDSAATNIAHEIFHHVENLFSNEIYGDGKLKKEFLSKRLWLKNFVNSYIGSNTMPSSAYTNTEYDLDFDKYLFSSLGYQLLAVNTAAVFPSAYSITSLTEYFAIGGEKFFCGASNDQEYLRSICPVLYEKLYNLKELS